VNSLPKTVTRQRHDCDSNPCSSKPESGTLTTRLPSHLATTVLITNSKKVRGIDGLLRLLHSNQLNCLLSCCVSVCLQIPAAMTMYCSMQLLHYVMLLYGIGRHLGHHRLKLFVST